MSDRKIPISGIIAALATPTFLGMAPIFGKQAILAGATPFSVAAVRTIFAMLMLWIAYAAFFRKYIYIYPAGLLGCVVIGVINGIGSLFYYSGLDALDASLVQLLNGMYLPFAVLFSQLGGQKADRRILIRVILAMTALFILTGFGDTPINWTGVGLMLGSALMFAGTIILSQYVLYEMPAPTVALYILTTMAIVVTMVWLVVGDPAPKEVWMDAMPAIVALGFTTALSRLAMFAGVKFLGGMQTAVLAITEIGVALALAYLVLGDRLSIEQWVGVGVLFTGILLIRQEDFLPRGYNPNALIAANMSSVQFQSIAFHRAFGTSDGSESNTMGPITTQEMVAIQQMMRASTGAIDPYPIGQSNRMNYEMRQITDALSTDEFSKPEAAPEEDDPV